MGNKINYGTVAEATKKVIITKIEAYNAALKMNDAVKIANAANELKDAESDYADEKMRSVFQSLSEKENVILEAVKMRVFGVVGHTTERENGVIKRVVIDETRTREIDLLELCKFCGKSMEWKYKAEKFNQLLTLRVASELKVPTARMKEICDSFYMSEIAQEKESGKTPDSNTAMCKELQKVFDLILFEDDGKGKNRWKVNNHDIAYMVMAYTRRSNKKALTISVAKQSYTNRLIFDVMHRVVTNKVYDVDGFKMKKDEGKKEEDKKSAK